MGGSQFNRFERFTFSKPPALPEDTYYAPQFGGGNNARVYRRAGEDPNGDGIVDNNNAGGVTNSDRNTNICPVTLAGVAPANKPWWVMDDCPWPNTALGNTSWYHDTDYRRGGFYNRWEGQWVFMLNVNLRALIDWNEANGGPLFTPGDSSDGGVVIFLSVQGPGVYNGGLENSLRLHEDWLAGAQKQFNYRGSFVTLGTSQHQLNDWSCADPACFGAIYNPPIRAWDYEMNFEEVEWLPPLTPMVTYVQHRSYTRFYK